MLWFKSKKVKLIDNNRIFHLTIPKKFFYSERIATVLEIIKKEIYYFELKGINKKDHIALSQDLPITINDNRIVILSTLVDSKKTLNIINKYYYDELTIVDVYDMDNCSTSQIYLNYNLFKNDYFTINLAMDMVSKYKIAELFLKDSH